MITITRNMNSLDQGRYPTITCTRIQISQLKYEFSWLLQGSLWGGTVTNIILVFCNTLLKK